MRKIIAVFHCGGRSRSRNSTFKRASLAVAILFGGCTGTPLETQVESGDTGHPEIGEVKVAQAPALRPEVRPAPSSRATQPPDTVQEAPEATPGAWYTVNVAKENGSVEWEVSYGKEGAPPETARPETGRQFSAGSVVKLRAKPDSGYMFTKWTGDLEGHQPFGALKIDSDKTLSAVFSEAKILTLKVSDARAGFAHANPSREPDRSIKNSTTELYLAGTEVDILVRPHRDSGFAFSHWTAPGVVDADGNKLDGTARTNFKLILDSDTVLAAEFVEGHQLTLNITRRGGNVRIDPGGRTYWEDTTILSFPGSVKSVRATPIPDELHYFSGWLEHEDPDPKTGPLTVPLDRNQVATAVFSRLWEGDGTKYFLRFLPSMNGIFLLSPPEEFVSELTLREFAAGAKVRVHPAPAKGWRLLTWIGDFHGSAQALDLVMNRDYDIMAEFAPITGVDGDADGDSLPDDWEASQFKDLSHDADGDEDKDGLLNFYEYHYGTNPNEKDSDEDGLPDQWESDHELNPASDSGQHGAEGDPDGDGHSNREEYFGKTHPTRPAEHG